MTVQGVIFDLGHTLMHLNDTWPQVFERGVAELAVFMRRERPDLDAEGFARALLACRKEGFAQARESMLEVTAEDSMRMTLARFGLPHPDPALVRGAIDAFFAYEETCWTADPEAVPVLRTLAAQGLRLGMYSNATDDAFIQGLVDRLGLRPWLAPALTSAWTVTRKPDPAAFAPILASWEVPAESVVVVGDTLEADILGAQRAGMRGIWFHSREDARQEGTDDRGEEKTAGVVPHAEIWGLMDLPRCLKRLSSSDAGVDFP